MQKAMFLMESYQKGILSEIDAGYILTVNSPDINDIQRKLDPFRIEMVSFGGVKSIHPIDGGLRFMSAGKKILALVEPTKYPNRHTEPAFRSNRGTESIPFRMKECDVFLTPDDRYRVILPDQPVDVLDSFTVEFPRRGDVCVVYFIFDDRINEVVLPYIAENLEAILRGLVNLQSSAATRLATTFVSNVQRFQHPIGSQPLR